MRTVYLSQKPNGLAGRVEVTEQCDLATMVARKQYVNIQHLIRCRTFDADHVAQLAVAFDDYDWPIDAIGMVLEILQRRDLGERCSSIELAVQKAVHRAHCVTIEMLPLCRELSTRGLLTLQLYTRALKAANSDVTQSLSFYPFLIRENRSFADFKPSLAVVLRACVAGAMSKYEPEYLMDYLLAMVETFDEEFVWLEQQMLLLHTMEGAVNLAGAAMSAPLLGKLCGLMCVLLEKSLLHLQFSRDAFPALEAMWNSIGAPLDSHDSIEMLRELLHRFKNKSPIIQFDECGR